MAKRQDGAPIIIKRRKIVAAEGHHGGAWKVAYADFVTAMMAFFMLMWLLSATNEQQRSGIADFFSPTVPIIRDSGGGQGALYGSDVVSDETLPKQSGQLGAVQRDGKGQTGEDSAEQQAFRDVDAQLRGLGGETILDDNLRRHVVTRLTDEGLIIEVFALPGAPLFDASSGRPTAVLRAVIPALAGAIGHLPNALALEGHVPARPVVMTEYRAWDVSMHQANQMRGLLESTGLEARRIARLTGHGDRAPVVADPMALRNNRLELILLREN